MRQEGACGLEEGREASEAGVQDSGLTWQMRVEKEGEGPAQAGGE